jgi:hypothetical protein
MLTVAGVSEGSSGYLGVWERAKDKDKVSAQRTQRRRKGRETGMAGSSWGRC